MNISKRLALTTTSATVTLALGMGLVGLASPAQAAPDNSLAAASEASASFGNAEGVRNTIATTVAKGAKAKVINYKRLTSKAKKVANKVRNDWRKIKVIGGWRAGSRYSGDHPAGRAIDVMIPKWKKNSKLGWSIAKYFAKNAKKYKVHYVIFRQKIWTTSTPKWRSMSNRGGATANHFDHVHISVKR